MNRIKISIRRKEPKRKPRICGRVSCYKQIKHTRRKESIRAPDDSTSKLSRISSEILMNEITNYRDQYAENTIILMEEELIRRNKLDEEKHKKQTHH